jgi:hypothetical protein
MTAELVDACLQSGEYVDSASPAIAAFAARVCGDATDDLTRAVRLYYAVRDEIVYTPYCDFRSRETFRASAASRGDRASASPRPRSSPRPRARRAFPRGSDSRMCATT